jgi:pimeloyl-ACP methyl ester carboxylesterase
MKRFARLAVLVVGLALSAIAVAGVLYRPDLSTPEGTPGAYVEVEGVPLRVLQEGQGRDILMIHGSPGILEDFDEQASRLRDSFRVTRYDRPGHGYSGDGGIYSLEYNARMALALADKLGLERAIVVGHSFGGSTALALARLKSPRVASIVVLDSAVYVPIRPVNPMYRFLRLPAFGLGLASVVPRSRTEATIGESITTEFKAAPPADAFRSTRMKVFSQPKVLHAIANEHSAGAAELARQNTHYGEIEIPVHVVAQRDDPARRETAERLQRETGRGELLLVAPSGHFVQVEQPEAVAELIRRVAGR